MDTSLESGFAPQGRFPFISDEEFAKSNKLGLWSMEFDYPWDWRKKN